MIVLNVRHLITSPLVFRKMISLLIQDSKALEAKKTLEETQAAYTGQLEEKHMEKLENGLKNRQEQLNQLIERLKDYVSLNLSLYALGCRGHTLLV